MCNVTVIGNSFMVLFRDSERERERRGKIEGEKEQRVHQLF